MKDQSRPANKLARAKERVAETATTKLAAVRQNEKTIDAAMRLGAVGAMFAVAEQFSSHMNAAGLRALAHFAEVEGYRQFGFDRFDEFLSKSPYSPLTRSQYYERKALLDREGDAVFDMLNTLRVPAAARKCLSDGSVQVDGDEIVIGDNRIPATDRDAVLEVVNTLTAKVKTQAATIERGKKDLREAKKRANSGSLAAQLDANPHERSLSLALAALAGLKTQAAGLSDEEAAAVRDNVMSLLRGAWGEIREAYRFGEAPTDFARASVSDQDVDALFA